jgi:hypothetical protein
MYQHGFVVPPLSKKDIYASAAGIRLGFTRLVGSTPRVPIDIMYELMPKFLPGFRLEVCFRSEIGDDHGRTFPEQLLIQLREDVYDGICAGNGRDRFTGAHELGHLFLHTGVALARKAVRDAEVPLYKSSEWQADTFASALLIDEGMLQQCHSIRQVMEVFGVSEAAARVRFKR